MRLEQLVREDIRDLAEVPLFSGREASEIDGLVEVARTRTLGAKEQLFHKPDEGYQVYVVMKGRLEAFTTSGGSSTLPQTYRGRLRELDYKTVRYPGHRDKVRAMRDLGLWSEEPVTIAGGRVKPRDLFETVAAESLAGDGMAINWLSLSPHPR